MTSLKNISNVELINRLKDLVKREQYLTVNILPHLIEVERRKLYLGIGFRSLYDYCTRELKYSESGAMRRIYAARAIEKCPSAMRYLRNGRVNLSTLSLVWKYISPEILNRISGKSKREVEAIVADFNIGHYAKDRTKPVVVERVIKQPATECKEIYRRGGGKLFASVDNSTRAKKEKVVCQKVKMHEVRCLIEDDVMERLERCKTLLSGKFPKGLNYSELLNVLSEAWLERHDPLKREERRVSSKQRSQSTSTPKSNGTVTRHIPAVTRDAIFNRDGGSCTFIGETGKRCESTWDVETHHDGRPFGRGGDHSPKNLRLLCRAHNQLQAEKEYGKQAIKKHYMKEAPVIYITGALGLIADSSLPAAA